MTHRFDPGQAEKARRTRLKRHVGEAREALKNADDHHEILGIFERLPRRMRPDVFLALDNDRRTANHGLLRRLRNDPDDGPRLFALFT